MLKRVGIGLAALIAVFIAVIASRPAAFHIERSARIDAAPEVVFGQVNDFHRWMGWSPWEKLDPEMKRTHGGTAVGLGASYGWSGDDKAGEGRMTITESQPNQRIGIKLEFIRPWAATNQVTFAFKADGPATKVTWTMEGTNNFVGKAFALIMGMDTLVGADFERGLSNLNQVCKAG